MDKLFIKDNRIKKRQNIQIEKDGTITFNPTDEMLFEAGWQVYVKHYDYHTGYPEKLRF
jgi:hypothetical protein